MTIADHSEGKRVLITQSSLEGIGGSEVQALELARYLHGIGCSVTVYTWMVNESVRALFLDAGIQVITSDMEESGTLRLANFDLIWVQHEVLPQVFFQQFGVAGVGPRPRVVFSHMSPYSEVHLEQPYTYDLENRLADVIVFNSEGTLEAQQAYFPPGDPRLAIYPNPAPMDFVNRPHVTRSALRKVLMVSNHTPAELLQAADLLRSDGIEVDRLGDVTKEANSLATPSLLDQYDCVVTIGKTVQYCLVQGIPVFVYDRFGGPGYLTAENYEQTARYNFSGRSEGGMPSLVHEMNLHTRNIPDGSTLAHQILDGYESACQFHTSRRNDFIRQFAIDGAVERVIGNMAPEPRHLVGMDGDYTDYLRRNSQMVQDYVRSNQLATNLDATFYQQQVQVFQGESRSFTMDDRTILLDSMQAENHIDIPAGDYGVCRIDFGERPCLITDVVVSGVVPVRVSISSNATFEDTGSMFFLSADPQLYIETNPRGTAINVTANVYPLEHVPSRPLGLVADRIRRRQVAEHAELEQWRHAGNQPLVALAMRVQRKLGSLKTRVKYVDHS